MSLGYQNAMESKNGGGWAVEYVICCYLCEMD